ncbi:MAG: hypothetical protein A3I61_06765 [Acidobacteria bacterium RIFCSPLOWO2_02_FULL_68_18]|nr:MAG: hypothetical protein A3I61_06765 [Acidobacteria bacterium RIFCSPLOWO2_02_FULL_68_18]
MFGFPPMQLPPNDSKREFGGAFADRPNRRRVLGIPVVWHDLALSLVYSAAIAAWLFVLGAGILRRFLHLCPARGDTLLFWITVVTWLAAFVILIALARQNDDETERISEWIDHQPIGALVPNRPNPLHPPGVLSADRVSDVRGGQRVRRVSAAEFLGRLTMIQQHGALAHYPRFVSARIYLAGV